MRNRRLTVPVLASLFSVIAILATAGPVFACTPPTITVGTCQYDVENGYQHHWTLYPDASYVMIEVSIASDQSNPVDLALTKGQNNDYPTSATVNTLYVRLDPDGHYGDNGAWESKAWSGDCPKADPTLNTTPGAGGMVGTVITDKATLAGGYTGTYSPTGWITFKLYGPNDFKCGNEPIQTWNDVPVAGNGDYITSAGYKTLAAGTYEWTAMYTGDSHNKAASSGCGEESVVIDQKTTIATVPVDENTGDLSGMIPDKVHDTATLTGLTPNAGGHVTYTLHSCTDSACASTTNPQDGGTFDVTGGVVPKSNTITLTEVGTYCWQADYSGDADNAPVAGKCSDEIIGTGTVSGETATPFYTPPPTSAGTGSSSSTMPLMALLICFVFGGLGLTAVGAQRRIIRR